MYTRVFAVTFVAFFVQFGQFSAAQSFDPSPESNLNQFGSVGSDDSLSASQGALDFTSVPKADTVSTTLFESSLSSSSPDIERQSDAQQRVVYNALQFVAMGFLLLVGVVVGTMIYTKRSADLFGTPGRHRDDW